MICGGSKAELCINPPTKCLLVGIFAVQLLFPTTPARLVDILSMSLKQFICWLSGWTTDGVVRIDLSSVIHSSCIVERYQGVNEHPV